jgi:two-component system sensor histidine kinase CpxA
VLTGPGGEYLFFAMEFDIEGRPNRGLMTPDARRIFLFVLWLLSGVACFLLARYLTRPIQAFRSAGQRIAAGDLAARVGPQVGQRRDEFGALAKDFDRMAEQVENLLESKQRLLRDVSHELRSPLGRMQAAVGLIRQRSGNAAEPHLDRIESEVETLNQMIGQILTFSRLQTLEKISREPVDMVELVIGVIDNARYEGRFTNREVTIEAPGHLQMELDAALVRSAVDNVVRNAVQHSKRVTSVRLTADAGGCTIHVADDGTGVDATELEHLFEPFFTGDSASRAARQGAGIGLAIAKRAVDLHQGRISTRNRPASSGEGGLEVVITLPV